MKTEELVPLTNGLSLDACGQMLVCDRASISAVRGDALDLKFRIAGTDFVPRLRLTLERVARATAEDLASIVRRVARHAIACH